MQYVGYFWQFVWLVLYFFSDSSGVDVTKSQDTPVAIKREDPYIIFDVDVEIQKPLEKMPKGKCFYSANSPPVIIYACY